jgi:hypothetical protein
MPPKFQTQINTQVGKEEIKEGILNMENIIKKEELDRLFERGDRVEMQKYYQQVLEKADTIFDIYAGKKRPRFEFTSDPKVTTAVFAVQRDGSNPQIKVGLDFFIKNKLSSEQAVWVLMHELTHFTDYARNKKAYMGQFENAEKLGIDMSDRLAQYYADSQNNRKDDTQNDGQSVEKKELTSRQKSVLADEISKIYSEGYYNIMNDIYVNHNVATTPEYTHDIKINPKTKQGQVSDLYKKVLFIEKDFSQMPEFYQYLYFLLRGENVDEGMRITEKTQAALSKDYKIKYKKYEPRRGFEVNVEKDINTEEIINTFLNPNSADALNGDTTSPVYEANKYTGKKVKDTDLKYRSSYIDQTLLLTFSELLFDDLKDKIGDMTSETDFDKLMDWLKDILGKMEKSSLDFMTGAGDVLDRYSDWKEGDDKIEAAKEGAKNKKDKALQDKADEKVVQDKIDKEKKEKEDIDKNRDEAMADIARKFAEKNNIAKDIVERVIAAEKDTREYIEKLLQVFRRIVLDNQNEMVTDYSDKVYRDGQQFSVGDFVRNMPKIIDGNIGEVELFKRLQKVDNPSDRPERIEVSLVIDQSGSMGNERLSPDGKYILYDGNKSEKNKVVERVVFMLNTALDKFNDLLADNRQKTRSKLHTDTEVIAYGNSAKHISKFRYADTGIEGVEDDLSSGKKGILNYKSFESIGVQMGSTYSHTAFDLVQTSIDDESREKLENKKILKIVIEITDGGSSNAVVAKEKIEKLQAEGCVVFAFQIEKVDADEKKTFENIWNTDNGGVALSDTEKRGFVVGEDFSKLPEMVAMALAKYIGQVQIYE